MNNRRLWRTWSTWTLRRTGTQAPVEIVPERLDRVSRSNDIPAYGVPGDKSLVIRVLGCVDIRQRQGDAMCDITARFTPKQRELLACLALGCEKGVHRETLNNAVWPMSPRSRPYNSLHNALSLLRRVVADATDGAVRDLVVRTGSLYRLNKEVANVDYWQFESALSSHGFGNVERIDSLEHAVALYRGELAEDLTSLWIETPREAARRCVLDALSVLVRHGQPNTLVRATNVLEQIRRADPYNERLYGDIIRAQARLGQIDAVRRTVTLLIKVLQELGQRPTAETLDLVASVQPRSSWPASAAAS
jgi:DNA-binding SARP family transcriptional activator